MQRFLLILALVYASHSWAQNLLISEACVTEFDSNFKDDAKSDPFYCGKYITSSYKLYLVLNKKDTINNLEHRTYLNTDTLSLHFQFGQYSLSLPFINKYMCCDSLTRTAIQISLNKATPLGGFAIYGNKLPDMICGADVYSLIEPASPLTDAKTKTGNQINNKENAIFFWNFFQEQ